MGKFSDILLCADLDDTLLSHDKSISDKNIRAINYFKQNGGLFAFCTGRVPLGTLPVLDFVTPNAPCVCFNGGAIYDFVQQRTLWQQPLDNDALRAVEYIDEHFPSAGIEVCLSDTVHFCSVNRLTERHKELERFPDNYTPYRDISGQWCKVIFMVEADEMESLKKTVTQSPFANKYTFVRTSPWYYEMLPKGVDKGAGLLRLADILHISRGNIIAAGDNENDISMILAAGRGIAVANAIEDAKKAAAYITAADNNSDAIAEIIDMLERNLI